MNRKLEKAADSLVYYFRLCARGSDIYWSDDNEVEIREIVENIYEGVDDLIDDKIDQHTASNYHAE